MEDSMIVNMVVRIMLVVNAIIFLVGVFVLLRPAQYENVEKLLGKELGGIRKKVIPLLETNVYILHNKLMENRRILGVVCVICALSFFLLALRVR